MKVDELPEPARSTLLRLPGRATGHVAIAVGGGEDPRAVVGAVAPGVEAVTLDGPDALGQPDLPELVRAVKARGLVCQVLGSGSRLVSEPALLRELVLAGVDRFLLPEEGADALDPLLALLDVHRVSARLVAAPPGGAPDLAPLLEARALHPCVDGAVVTLLPGDLARAAASLEDELRIAPVAWRPTEEDDGEVAVLVWLFWLNVRTGRAVPVVPTPETATAWLYQRIDPRRLFAETMPGARGVGVAAKAAELLAHPARAAELGVLLMGARGTEDLRFQCLALRRG